MTTDNASLFAIDGKGVRLTIDLNLSGQLVISIGGAGVGAGIALSAADLYELSNWIERYLDGEDNRRIAEDVNPYLLLDDERAHAIVAQKVAAAKEGRA